VNSRPRALDAPAACRRDRAGPSIRAATDGLVTGMMTGDYQDPQPARTGVNLTQLASRCAARRCPIRQQVQLSRGISGADGGRWPGSVMPAMAAMRSPFRFWYVP